MQNKRRTVFGIVGAWIATVMPRRDATAAEDRDFARQREQMVAEIAAIARATGAETGRMSFSDAVMAALRSVPRHRFVPSNQVASTYRNHPLAIGRGQTISQPYIVALTTDLIDPKKHHKVLEIGTGSGYQAAILAHIVDKVYSIEIIDSLGREAAERLRALGYANVSVRVGDGHLGWPEHAPYDAIVVTAAAKEIPDALIKQLAPGGRMVIPVGPQHRSQDFVLIEKRADGSLARRVVLPVMFVPMTGGGAQ